MTDIVLLTGATGFVGSAVARSLLQAGFHVRALVRQTSRLDNLRSLDLEIVRGDVRLPDTLAKPLEGCRGVFHVAADYRLWARQPTEIYASNVDGSRNVMHAAARAGVGRIVYTSSVATLGLHADGTPADEETPAGLIEMIGDYKRSKFLAERAVCELAQQLDLDLVVVNPAAPVGPRDIKPTPTGQLILDAARGRMPAYVDDVATGHLLAYEHGKRGRRYILGGENLSLLEILSRVAALAGRRPPALRLPHAAVLPAAWLAEGWARVSGKAPAITVAGARLARKHMYFSHARASRELGYRPRPAQQALVDALQWFAENGYLKRPVAAASPA